MLGPLARSRALCGAAVLLTAAAGGVVLAPGASSAPTASGARTYGPVAAAPVARPLVDLSAPLLGSRGSAGLAPRTGVMGPRAGAAEIGPPASIGPDSSPAQVRRVQRLLNVRGAGLRVDGAWGPATTRAVATVQAVAGLTVTGRADPMTLAHLRGQR